MRKLLTLAIKEIIVTFRDVGALMTMLLTPLLLTLAIAAAFGVGGDTSLPNIPVRIRNKDTGQFSQAILDAFENQKEGLLEVELIQDETAARELVDEGNTAALVIVPEHFSDSALPLAGAVQEQLGLDLLSLSQEDIEQLSPEQQQEIGRLFFESQGDDGDVPIIEIYASPDYQISVSVIQGILRGAIERLNMTLAGTNAIITRLVEAQMGQGLGEPSELDPDLSFGGDGFDSETSQELSIHLEVTSPSGRGFNWLDYSAASMAILFLMFAVTSGGRTILAEKQMGTLSRLVITPTQNLTILIGKMAGIMLTGLLQVLVLWGATSLIGAYWGPPLGVLVTLILLVLCATGVGALISAWAKSAGQAGAIGSAFSLIAAASSGSFFPRMNLPQFLQTISFITPNAWGIEIFARLQSGDNLQNILPMLGGVLVLTIVYYTIAAFGFRRKFN